MEPIFFAIITLGVAFAVREMSYSQEQETGTVGHLYWPMEVYGHVPNLEQCSSDLQAEITADEIFWGYNSEQFRRLQLDAIQANIQSVLDREQFQDMVAKTRLVTQEDVQDAS